MMPLVIEGAGGLMVPLTRELLRYLDLLPRWRLPVVLCARERLSAPSTTRLLSIEALRLRDVAACSASRSSAKRMTKPNGPSCEMGGVKRLGPVAGSVRTLTRDTLRQRIRRRHFDLERFRQRAGTMSGSPVWHPFTQHALQPEAIQIASGEGAWLETRRRPPHCSMRSPPGGW